MSNRMKPAHETEIEGEKKKEGVTIGEKKESKRKREREKKREKDTTRQEKEEHVKKNTSLSTYISISLLDYVLRNNQNNDKLEKNDLSFSTAPHAPVHKQYPRETSMWYHWR